MIFIPQFQELLHIWNRCVKNKPINEKKIRKKKILNFLKEIGFLDLEYKLTQLGKAASQWDPNTDEFRSFLADRFIQTKDGELLTNTLVMAKSKNIDYLLAHAKQSDRSITKANLHRGLKLLENCNRLYYDRRSTFNIFTGKEIKEEILFLITSNKLIRIKKIMKLLQPKYQSRTLIETELLKLIKEGVVDIESSSDRGFDSLLLDILKKYPLKIPLTISVPFRIEELNEQYSLEELQDVVNKNPEYLTLGSTSIGGQEDFLLFKKFWDEISQVKIR